MATIDKKGIIHGRAGSLIYRGLGDGQVVQGIPSKMRQSVATKASSLEFGLASTTARAIRHYFFGASYYGDGGMINRFTQTVLKSIRAGNEAETGLRDLHQADLSLIEGFEFNKNSTLAQSTIPLPEVVLLDDGSVQIDFPEILRHNIEFPNDANNIVIRVMVLAIDFKKEIAKFLGTKDIKLGRTTNLKAETWEVEEKARQGNILLVSFALRYFAPDGFNLDAVCLNNKDLNPSGIIAARHVNIIGTEADTPWTDRRLIAGYYGNILMEEFKRIQSKIKTKKPLLNK